MAAAPQKNRLGRGLASLIGDLEDEKSDGVVIDGQQLVPIDAIEASTFNPRRDFDDADLNDLAASIREKGIVQPIIVRPGKKVGRYEIVAGERRWRAAQKAAQHKIPIIVRTLSDQESLELAIIENVQRSDLNAIEEARGYKQLMDRYKHTQEDLSNIVGKSRSHLANMLRLLKLPKKVQGMVEEGQLSAGHARALVGHEDAVSIAKDIVRRSLSVRDVETLIQDDGASAKKKVSKPRVENADTRAAERELTEALGLAVTLKTGKGEAGEVRIRFRSLEQFEEIQTRLLANTKKQ